MLLRSLVALSTDPSRENAGKPMGFLAVLRSWTTTLADLRAQINHFR
jgi:hypothetical protein